MRITDDEFWEAWAATRRGGRAPGPDGVSLPDFRRDAVSRLARLGRLLRSGRYAPGPYRQVSIPKPYGGFRTISVANIADRVVQRVLHNRLLPHIEAVSLPCSYAYRPNLSHRDAWEAVDHHRVAGFDRVLEADVEKCFDRIRTDLVAEMLAEVVDDPALVELVLECITAGHGPAGMGLPQGAVLSPSLCNLVLSELDRALSRRHTRVVRYADDLVVLCRSAGGLSRARERAEYTLWSLGLNLNTNKTRVSDFRSGFDFLGARFVAGMIMPGRPSYVSPRTRGSSSRYRSRKLTYVF